MISMPRIVLNTVVREACKPVKLLVNCPTRVHFRLRGCSIHTDKAIACSCLASVAPQTAPRITMSTMERGFGPCCLLSSDQRGRMCGLSPLDAVRFGDRTKHHVSEWTAGPLSQIGTTWQLRQRSRAGSTTLSCTPPARQWMADGALRKHLPVVLFLFLLAITPDPAARSLVTNSVRSIRVSHLPC